MDWKDCLGNKTAKNVNLDLGLINSLIKTSENKLKSSQELKMNETNASSKFSLVYDSLRELLEALALINGYKIYNHECYTSFLKEILNESNKGDEFDEIRKVRNKVNYYGQEITVDESSKIIKSIDSLRTFVLSLLKKK